MITFDFYKINEIYSSAEDIKVALEGNPEGFIFKVVIHSARHYSDLAQDCLEAAFIGQQLAEFCQRLSVTKNSEYGHDSIVEFVFKPLNTAPLSQLIYSYGLVSSDNQEAASDFMDKFITYRDSLEESDHSFPELVDDYYANYINGEYYEYDPVDNEDFFKREFSQFPERSFGFVKSAYSKKINQDFYTSLDCIIIPPTSDLDLVLKEYSGIENISLRKAEFFAMGNITYLISDGYIVHFPFDAFIKAKSCAWEALEPAEEIYSARGSWSYGLLSFDRVRAGFNEQENLRGYPEDRAETLLNNAVAGSNFLAAPPVVCFYLSSYGDHILVKDSRYSYFFFGTDKLKIEELGFLGNRLSVLFSTTAHLAGIHIEIKCPWEQLNDESFEELCFDVIYHNPGFNNDTIRKMGKARSRDGGRDIEVFTHSRPGRPAEKYIFQCKYLQPGSSLTGSKVLDISDVITQHGASGYGIMTNVVIDATLYDKLDGINRTLKIDTKDYSVYKLERILASYPQIKQRHFIL